MKKYKYLPTNVAESVLTIDYNALYAEGKRIILFDLDNTLGSYRDLTPSLAINQLINQICQVGFQVHIISNNAASRVRDFAKNMAIAGTLPNAKKPRKGLLEAYLARHNLAKEQTILIGDQLLTDIALANKVGVDSTLVKTVDPSSEKWYTRANKLRLLLIMPMIKKQNNPLYQAIKAQMKKGNQI